MSNSLKKAAGGVMVVCYRSHIAAVALVSGLVVASVLASGVCALGVDDRQSGVQYQAPAGWRQAVRYGSTSAIVSPDDRASVTVSFVRITPNSLEHISDVFLKAGPASYRSFNLLMAERDTAGGKLSLHVVFEFEMGRVFRQEHFKVPCPGGYIDVVFNAVASDWQRFEPSFETVRTSLKFAF